MTSPSFLQFAPLNWLAAAARAAGTDFGLHVAVLLQFRHGLTKANPVIIPSRLEPKPATPPAKPSPEAT